MDRLAFLRSLPYLRQLDHEIWEAAATGNDETEEVYSGSTITPPTPSKNNSQLLFEEPVVVSIEPIIFGNGKVNVDATNHHGDVEMETEEQSMIRRKRGQLDISATTCVNHPHSTSPAFFQQYSGALAIEEKAQEEELDTQRIINNDPAICSFEAAIVKHNPNPLASPVQKSGKEITHDDENDDNNCKSSWLLFRFGCRFVFLADAVSIINVTYEPSIDGTNHSEENKDAIQSPPMKRRKQDVTAACEKEASDQEERTNGEKVTTALPASLVMSFPFCSFRIFQNQKDSSDEPKVTRSFLLKTVITEEERLLKARSLLLKEFELDEEEGRRHNRLLSRRIQQDAPVANGTIPPFPLSKASKFLSEDWTFCLDAKKSLPPCTSLPPSPQKSESPSKNGSSSAKDSSSIFENGQKDYPPQNISKENTAETSNEGEGGSKNKEETNGEDNLEEDDKNVDCDVQDSEEKDECDKTVSSAEKKSNENHDVDVVNDVTNQTSWKHELLNKRSNFDASWSFVQKAMQENTTEAPSTHDDRSISHLTHAAQSLSSSYISPDKLSDMSLKCEDDIAFATKGIQQEIERIFPGRGSRKSTGSIPADLGNFKEKIENLLCIRKEAVDAKLAMLLTPKR